MNTNNFISLHEVIDNLYFNPMMENCPEEYMIAKIAELNGVISMPCFFEDKEADIKIEDHKAMLPCDFLEMQAVMLLDENCCNCNCDHHHHIHHKMFVGKTGIMSYKSNDDQHEGQCAELNYKIQGNIIYTSIKEGNIRISYRAFAIDEDGYPMIIDNANYKRAVASYITSEWYKILLAQNKININSVQIAENDYLTNIGNAVTSMYTPTYDQMESLSRILNTLLPNEDHHGTAFKHLAHRNTLRRH